MCKIKCVYLGENVGKLTTGLALVSNDLQKCSIDVMFEKGPECQTIFKSSKCGVPCTIRWILRCGIARHAWFNVADNSAKLWTGWCH